MATILIVGAGNGGLAAAADLTLRGHQVVLYNRSAETVELVRSQQGVRYSGVLGEGFAPLSRVVDRLDGEVAGADLILLCLPATAHGFAARALAPHLEEGQRLLLNPGGMMGSLAFLQGLRQAGFQGTLRIAETGTLTYICRKPDAGAIGITSLLSNVPCAAFPGCQTQDFLESVKEIIPRLVPARHVLEAGFSNVNAVLHPPGMILGAAWIEHTGGKFLYYLDAATPAVARLLQALDGERIEVARAWGVQVPTFPQLFASIGSTSQEAADRGDYLQTLLDSKPNHAIQAPPSLDHRYMHEDIPYGLAPMVDLAKKAEVEVPTMQAVVQMASTATGIDYWSQARTLSRVGLEGMSREQIFKVLVEGEGWR